LTEAGTQPVAWITGAGGLIGNYLARSPFVPAGWRLVPLGRGDLDLTDRVAVERRFRLERPKLVIHCAAISKTTECEQQPELARRVNVEVPAQLAELCAEARLVFLSTDLVFDGRRGHYVETDAVNPLGVYAETKVAAEQRVLAFPHHVVVRTSLNAGRSPTGDRSFNEQLRCAWREGRTLRLFTDEFRCPIPAEVTARALWELALKSPGGLYHLAGAERLSRWEMGRLLAGQCREVNPQIEPASLAEYRGAPRSPDCSLNCARAQAELSFPLPRFSDWLATHSVF
jgi:dTDP-4-dehydrorhamnose reductase